MSTEPNGSKLGEAGETFTRELAARIEKDSDPAITEFIQHIIRRDIRRMGKDQFRRWKLDPRGTTQQEWREDAFYRRALKRIKRLGNEPKYAWRIIAGEPVGKAVAKGAGRLARTGITAALGVAAALPLTEILPGPWKWVAMGAAALLGTGTEKAARTIVGGRKGDPTYGWWNLVRDIAAAISRFTTSRRR